jgi:hypothetical protein
MIMGVKRTKGVSLMAYLAGQFFVRLPYYSVSMLRAGHPSGPLAYLQGLFAGSKYLLSRPD